MESLLLLLLKSEQTVLGHPASCAEEYLNLSLNIISPDEVCEGHQYSLCVCLPESGILSFLQSINPYQKKIWDITEVVVRTLPLFLF